MLTLYVRHQSDVLHFDYIFLEESAPGKNHKLVLKDNLSYTCQALSKRVGLQHVDKTLVKSIFTFKEPKGLGFVPRFHGVNDLFIEFPAQ